MASLIALIDRVTAGGVTMSVDANGFVSLALNGPLTAQHHLLYNKMLEVINDAEEVKTLVTNGSAVVFFDNYRFEMIDVGDFLPSGGEFNTAVLVHVLDEYLEAQRLLDNKGEAKVPNPTGGMMTVDRNYFFDGVHSRAIDEEASVIGANTRKDSYKGDWAVFIYDSPYANSNVTVLQQKGVPSTYDSESEAKRAAEQENKNNPFPGRKFVTGPYTGVTSFSYRQSGNWLTDLFGWLPFVNSSTWVTYDVQLVDGEVVDITSRPGR